jgi:hypothetical protein
MLPDLAVPASLLAVLGNLRVFTAPTYLTFTALVIGLIAKTGEGTVTGCSPGRGGAGRGEAGLVQSWSHDRAHGFFSRASWNAEIPGDRGGDVRGAADADRSGHGTSRLRSSSGTVFGRESVSSSNPEDVPETSTRPTVPWLFRQRKRS